MPNVWRWQAKDKDGKVVEPAPGKTHFISRGPGRRKDMIDGATILLNNKRRAAIREGLEDPGYAVVPESVEAVETADQSVLGVGAWRPSGSKQVNLPTDPAVNEAKTKRLIEQG